MINELRHSATPRLAVGTFDTKKANKAIWYVKRLSRRANLLELAYSPLHMALHHTACFSAFWVYILVLICT